MRKGKAQSDKEMARIAEMYPQALQTEILEALPSRTWSTIQTRAYLIGVKRTVKLKESVAPGLTWSDMLFLQVNSLTMHSFTHGNQTEWLTESPSQG
jgi:hypothetical protein